MIDEYQRELVRTINWTQEAVRTTPPSKWFALASIKWAAERELLRTTNADFTNTKQGKEHDNDN